MRLLFALLLLANIAWYAWSHWVVQPAGEAVAARAEGPKLVLAREAPPAQPAPRQAARAASNCLSLGPFSDLTDAARASTLLRENQLQPRQRAGEGVVWRGFWVSLGGIPDRAAADGLIERLRRFGIGDAYAMPDDGSLITISLGLFSEQQRALRRMDDVKALGLEPRIVERERKGTVYWIDVNVEPPAKLPDAAQLHGEGGRILRLQVQPCGAVSG
ncbi:MAG: SPOR domain-containing protein [Steroidobacteraceae bacterium]